MKRSWLIGLLVLSSSIVPTEAQSVQVADSIPVNISTKRATERGILVLQPDHTGILYDAKGAYLETLQRVGSGPDNYAYVGAVYTGAVFFKIPSKALREPMGLLRKIEEPQGIEEVYVSQVHALVTEGNSEEALEHIDLSLQVLPNSARLHQERAYILPLPLPLCRVSLIMPAH
ncbi:hypothetical protein [Anthocerotibacter panamensis]|uniref:hypothetical protein n=1 Tax=Anthocerotibacter panamensis TaxID=2857077 RepID=UPI001C401E2C|nr:hypothetical protein [Anthocerotibacter panamensis]